MYTKTFYYTVTVAETEVSYSPLNLYRFSQTMYNKTFYLHCDSDGNGSQLFSPKFIQIVKHGGKTLYTKTCYLHCDSDETEVNYISSPKFETPCIPKPSITL